jgi:hypothetical protein
MRLAFLLAIGVIQAQPTPTVGLQARIEGLVLPGSELIAKPLEDQRSPIVLRIERASRHGTAFRYDLVYHGLEPGSFDLRNWLQRKDNSSMDGVPPIPVEIRAAYAGPMRPVNESTPGSVGLRGRYKTFMIALGVAWVVMLVVLILTRKRKALPGVVVAPRTLADRLRTYVEKAARSGLTRDEQAELERLLLSFWRKREGLEGMEVSDALAELRRRETPGALLRALEEWLHRPGPPREMDVAALLGPYQREPDVPAAKGSV